MIPFYGTSSENLNGYNFMHWFTSSQSSMEMMMMEDDNNNPTLTTSSSLSSKSMSDTKAIAANKSHSEAERRRRERINGHLSTLRTLLPNTIKTDKASLLAEVVQHVRELKKVASDIVSGEDGDGCWLSFPQETDELMLSYVQNPNEESSSSLSSLIRVSFCCEDRPELMADLAQAMKSVGLKVVKAEISTAGGRVKSILTIQSCGGNGGGRRLEELGMLRRVLKGVLDKPAVSGGGRITSGSVVAGNKRPRISQGHHNNRLVDFQ